MHSMSFPIRVMVMGVSLLALPSAPALAHEFWIEPETYRPTEGDRVRAEIFVGGMLKGEAYPYLSNQIVSAQLHAPSGVTEIEGMEGDLPALAVTPTEPGLHVISYHSAPAYIEYEDFETFVNYLAYEGLDDVVRLHKDRGLPDSGFTEAYTRNARTLLQVGPVVPKDLDRPTGMPLELVALQNPLSEGLAEIEVQLLSQGSPVPNRQVSIFHRAAGGEPEGEVTRSLVTTNAEGVAVIPVSESGFFLLNAVQMKPVDGAEGVVWESHWASLTFAVEAP